MEVEFTADEITQLVESFKALGVKPKMDDAVALQGWMTDFIKSQEEHENGDGDGEADEEDGEADKEENDSSTKQTAPVTVVSQPPRLSTFSGDPNSKGDTTFDLWKYEVQCLLLEAAHPHAVVVHAIRKSLKGEAGKIAMRLGPKAAVTELLDKLEGVYGTVEQGESLLADFYSAQQKVDEDVVRWSCRLEDLLDKAKRRGHVTSKSMNEMLRTKFWLGLQPALRDKSRHLFDKYKSFDDIRVQLRIIEHELKLQQKDSTPIEVKKPGQVKKISTSSATTTDGSGLHKDMTELRGMVSQLAATVQGMQQEVSKWATKGSSYVQSTRAEPDSSLQATAPAFTPAQVSSFDNYQGPQCWRCGQYGHLKNGCRVRLDHMNLKKPLN